MISRRHLIGSGLAASAAVLGSPAGFALNARTSVPLDTHLLIDARFDEAVDIARLTAPAGARIIVLPRDVLPLWHDELLPALQRGTHALAGVTTEYSCFTLRTLAADQRLRTRITARHESRTRNRDEALLSWEIGPAASFI